MPQVRIDSILGGMAPTTNFAAADQFRACFNIDPSLPIDDNTGTSGFKSTIASGLIRPVGVSNVSGTTITAAPMWMISNPKDSNIYIYDINGSAYTTTGALSSVTPLADAGTLGTSGNGAEYYDNYIYFAKDTDITRYGPLNGSPGFVNNYWTGTLGKGALTNTTYPADYQRSLKYPNHILHRHSDGKLYIADVVGNKGTIHYIATTKTTVEGDTDNGSTANKLQFGYGLWPTAMESYGSYLAIALVEGSSSSTRQERAKLAIWDTTSVNANQITWVEFPDPIITALKNVNGILYIISGNTAAQGFRVSRYVGGYTFEEVFYSETGEPCFPGALEATQNRLLIGSFTTIPTFNGCVWSLGLQKANLSQGVFIPMSIPLGNNLCTVTCLGMFKNSSLSYFLPVFGWDSSSALTNGVTHGLVAQSTTDYSNPAIFWSQMYRVGQHFRINSISVPFAQNLTANSNLSIRFLLDDGSTSVDTQLIDTNAYPTGGSQNYAFVQPATPVEGLNNFWVQLTVNNASGTDLLVLSLPIIIDYSIIPN